MIAKIIQLVEGDEVCALCFYSLKEYELVCAVLEKICEIPESFTIDDTLILLDGLICDGQIEEYEILDDVRGFILPGELEEQVHGCCAKATDCTPV
jgi:hypothetical protein